MAIVMDRVQRDALYGFVVCDLAEVGHLAVALEEDEVLRARQLREHFDQAARLLDQIGWERLGNLDCYEVVLEDRDARALFERLRERAVGAINDAMSEFANQVLKEAYGVAEFSSAVLETGSRLTPRQLRPVDRMPGPAT
jgi:hypothetical protein